jgi:hypothetical protein
MASNLSALLLNSSKNSKHNNNNSFKYKLDCQNIIDKSENPDTKDWLYLEKQIEHDSPDYILYTALLEKHKQIVVKIGPEKLQNEYEIGKLLEVLKLPTFLRYNCIFSCFDDFYTFRGKTKAEKDFLNSKRTSLCKKEGEKINVLVMPYINSGTIDKYMWTVQNFDILKNVIKHIVISILYAAVSIGFIHTDAHLGNIMIHKTKRHSIKYGDFYNLEVISGVSGGVMPIIMDYDKAIIQGEMVNVSLVYNDINKLFNLLNVELKIKFNISKLLDLFRILTINKIQITTELCTTILLEIDKLEIYLDLTQERELPDFLKPISSRKK